MTITHKDNTGIYINAMSSGIINELEPFMLTMKNRRQWEEMVPSIVAPKESNLYLKELEEKPQETKKRKQQQEDRYNVFCQDSLFWTFFIMKNGFFEYESKKTFEMETSEKFKCIDMMRQNKDLLKRHKIKSYSAIEDDLGNNRKISLKTFMALCLVEQLNVIFIRKRKIISVILNETEPTWLIHQNAETNMCSIELDVTPEKIKKYCAEYLCVDNYDSPLKSMSAYKLDELKEMCYKLNMQIGDLKNKKDIYELLVMKY